MEPQSDHDAEITIIKVRIPSHETTAFVQGVLSVSCDIQNLNPDDSQEITTVISPVFRPSETRLNTSELEPLSIPVDDPITLSFIEDQPQKTLTLPSTKKAIESRYAVYAIRSSLDAKKPDFTFDDVKELFDKRDNKVRPLREDAYNAYLVLATKKHELYRAYDRERKENPIECPTKTFQSIRENLEQFTLDSDECTRFLCLRKHQRDFAESFIKYASKTATPSAEDVVNQMKDMEPNRFFLHPNTYLDFLRICPNEGIFPTLA
jgi:hypothetical protein